MVRFRVRPTRRAQELRNNATEAEKRLWRHLSRRQLGGYKFSRQMPVGPFICDFLCREAALVVELDGGQHDLRAAYDGARTRFIEAQGYRVLLYWNNDVMANVEAVLEAILKTLDAGPLSPPPPTPPASGRGES